jgi:phosphoribulokinase
VLVWSELHETVNIMPKQFRVTAKAGFTLLSFHGVVMSAKHPVIAVTGSSGAGTTTTSLAFRKIFAQLNLHAAEVEGDSFHRYTRPEMDMAIRKARDQGKHISYFGPEANDFGLLEQTFIEYGQTGKGQSRKYLHTYDEAVPWNQVPGTRCLNRLTSCFMRACTAAL